jgi:long-subunit acyl-CoA synthetase (AMP-forming)
VALATSCIADRQRLRRDDVLVSATPATSSFQLVAALLPAAHAGCQFVPTQRLSGPDIWQVVDQWRATVLTAYTPVLSEALAHAPAGGTTLRLAMCGGAPLPSRLKLDYQRRLHVPLIEAYGQSEVGGFVAMGDPLDRDPRALSHTGRPLPDRPAWAEPDGDLVVAGQVMQGYLGDEEATRSALRPPGLRTGDVGISDAAGYIQILGRQGEQLADGRWPRQIEDALFDDPDVLHAVLVRPPGGRLVGAVVPQADAKLDTGRLARSAGVDDVVVRARFPRTSSGKYDRRALALELTS